MNECNNKDKIKEVLRKTSFLDGNTPLHVEISVSNIKSGPLYEPLRSTGRVQKVVSRADTTQCNHLSELR
jgi:hypothetical protein